MIYFDKATQEV